MRTVTVGIAILGIGILAALPFRHRRGEDAEAGGKAISAAPRPSVAPLEEVPLEQFAQQQQYWAAARQRPSSDANTAASIRSMLPQLPASYTEVAVPLATPQAVADRYSATGPLRGGRRADRPAADLASTTAAAVGQQDYGQQDYGQQDVWQQDVWQRGLPLGAPLRGAAAVAGNVTPSGTPAATDEDRAVAEAGSPKPWPSPEEIARATQSQQESFGRPDEATDRSDEPAGQSVASARPAGHAITAVSSAIKKETAEQSERAATEAPRQRFYIREPVH